MFENLSFRNIYSKFAKAEIGTKVLFQQSSGDNFMKSLKVKNRQRKALRNGKNNSRFNNRVTTEQIMVSISRFLEANTLAVLKAAKHFYEVAGSGCVNISLIDHPDCPFQAERLHYVTEENNNEMLLSSNTDWNIQLSEEIAAYEPTTQAVVCFWYGRRHYTTILTDSYAAMGAVWNNRSLMVH